MNTPSKASDANTTTPQTSDNPTGSKKIVVGVDGSESSVAALRQAVALARAVGAHVEAIIAWSYPEMALSAPTWTLLPSLEDNSRTIATDAANEVFGEDWPEWFSVRVHQGSTSLVLIDASETAEMLVLGSRGLGGFAGLLLGSVSAHCAQNAKCPVLIVRGLEPR